MSICIVNCMSGRLFLFSAAETVKSLRQIWFSVVIYVGRAVRTKGQRRIGKTIRRLEASVELSSKETKAKVAEQKYKQAIQTDADEDSPVQNLRDLSRKKTNSA